MKLGLTLALAVGASLASAGAAPALLFLSTASTQSPLRLDAQQANAVLAHSLGVSQYEHLPQTTSADAGWQQALASTGDWSDHVGNKIVILLETGSEGCDRKHSPFSMACEGCS